MFLRPHHNTILTVLRSLDGDLFAEGPIPESAWEKAEEAYSEKVRASYERAVDRIRDPDWLKSCMTSMQMEPGLADEILAVHGGPK